MMEVPGASPEVRAGLDAIFDREEGQVGRGLDPIAGRSIEV